MLGIGKKDALMTVLKFFGPGGIVAAGLVNAIWQQRSQNNQIMNIQQQFVNNPNITQNSLSSQFAQISMSKLLQLKDMYSQGQMRVRLQELQQRNQFKISTAVVAVGLAISQTIQIFNQIRYNFNIDSHSVFLLEYPTNQPQQFLNLKVQMLNEAIRKGGKIFGVIPAGGSIVQNIEVNFVSLNLQDQSIFTIVTPNTINVNKNKINKPMSSWQLRFNSNFLVDQALLLKSSFLSTITVNKEIPIILRDIIISYERGQRIALIQALRNIEKRIPILNLPANSFQQKLNQIQKLVELLTQGIRLTTKKQFNQARQLANTIIASILNDKILIVQNSFIIPQDYDMKLISHIFQSQSIVKNLQKAWTIAIQNFQQQYDEDQKDQIRIAQVKQIFKQIFQIKVARYDQKIFQNNEGTKIQLAFNAQYFNKIMRSMGFQGVSPYVKVDAQLAIKSAIEQLAKVQQNKQIHLDSSSLLKQLNKTFYQASYFQRLRSYLASFIMDQKPRRFVQLGPAQRLKFSKRISEAWYKGAESFFQNQWMGAVFGSIFTYRTLGNFSWLSFSIFWIISLIRKHIKQKNYEEGIFKKIIDKYSAYFQPTQAMLKAVFLVTPSLIDSKILLQQIQQYRSGGWKFDTPSKIYFSIFAQEYQRFLMGYTKFLRKDIFAIDSQGQRRKIALTKYKLDQQQKYIAVDPNSKDVYNQHLKRGIQKNIVFPKKPNPKMQLQQEEQDQIDDQTPKMKTMTKQKKIDLISRNVDVKINNKKPINQMKLNNQFNVNYKPQPLPPPIKSQFIPQIIRPTIIPIIKRGIQLNQPEPLIRPVFNQAIRIKTKKQPIEQQVESRPKLTIQQIKRKIRIARGI